MKNYVEDCFGKKQGCEYPECDCKQSQPVPVKGEGKVEPDFIEWCKQERINFSNGMLHEFDWYELTSKQRVIAENFMICFDQLFEQYKTLRK